MKNNKAFTLIELLAVVIVIGLLVVLIAPKVKSTIEDSTKSSAELSAQALLRNATNYYLEKRAQNNNFEECTYDFTNNINTCNNFEFTGEAPTSGTLTINIKGEISGTITFNKKYNYCISDNKVTEGTC